MLHICKHIRVCSIPKGNAASSDLAMNGGKATKDNVVVHEKGILLHPVLRGVEVPGLRCIEARLNALDRDVAMLFCDAVKFYLQSDCGSLYQRPFRLLENHDSVLGTLRILHC